MMTQTYLSNKRKRFSRATRISCEDWWITKYCKGQVKGEVIKQLAQVRFESNAAINGLLKPID